MIEYIEVLSWNGWNNLHLWIPYAPIGQAGQVKSLRSLAVLYLSPLCCEERDTLVSAGGMSLLMIGDKDVIPFFVLVVLRLQKGETTFLFWGCICLC